MPRTLSATDVSEFRERLRVVAEELFAQYGPQAVTIRQIATALGVSPMTPYRYFRDKDDIVAVVRTSAFDRFASALETARALGGEPVAASRRVGEAYIAFALEHPAAYHLMFDLAQPPSSDHPELTAAVSRARSAMTAHVDDMFAAGLLEGDAETIAHVFWAMLHGAIGLQLAGKLGPDVDPRRVRSLGFEVLTKGLGLRE